MPLRYTKRYLKKKTGSKIIDEQNGCTKVECFIIRGDTIRILTCCVGRPELQDTNRESDFSIQQFADCIIANVRLFFLSLTGFTFELRSTHFMALLKLLLLLKNY